MLRSALRTFNGKKKKEVEVGVDFSWEKSGKGYF
jgi:hypothetical protein